VVYEYANFLASRGHAVSVVHPALFRVDEPLATMPLKRAVKTIWSYLKLKATGGFRPTAWFQVSPAVRMLWTPSLAARYIPPGDVVVATAWETAEWAGQYPAEKGRRFYLIQHLESWSGPETRVLATWKLPLTKIVIARWLQEIAEGLGERAHLVYNGLDFRRFHLTHAIEERNPHQVLMIFHALDWKGSADGIAAFELARSQEPGLHLTLFGVAARPDGLPDGVVYHQNPSQEAICELYNDAAIFVSASWTEGFSLPPAEALQCGAALALTDIAGPASYAFHERTALLSPVRDPGALAANILRLAHDGELRMRLARSGHELIQDFTWERAGTALEAILRGG
jgi:glycosyltransferase involved in cell wall biosynthesis